MEASDVRMKLLKPPRLVDGDTIGVIAPSLPVSNLRREYELGVSNLKARGFKVREGQTVNLSRRGYMAGTDSQRAEDINRMFADEEVRGIMCAAGGSVALRTLRYLDYEMIQTHPKVFSGMSDITVLHLALLSRAGLSGLHQSDVCFGFGKDLRSSACRYETDLFLRVTKNAVPLGSLPSLTIWEAWREGHAEGRLFGGNCNSIQAVIGTPYFKKPTGPTLFFFEAYPHTLEAIDRALVQFREVGLFDNTTGMLVGKIRGNKEDGSIFDMTSEVRDVLLDVTSEFDFPIIGSMDFGHHTPNLPLPMGINASMDTERMVVSLDESYVR